MDQKTKEKNGFLYKEMRKDDGTRKLNFDWKRCKARKMKSRNSKVKGFEVEWLKGVAVKEASFP